MDHPPSVATSQQTYLEDINRRVAEARASGGFTAVVELAQKQQDELRREFAALTAGHELRPMSSGESEELRRTWTPEKARLNEHIREVDRQIRAWARVENDAAPHVANEALGWKILDDGTPAKVLANGKVLTVHGGVRYEEEDGTIVDTSQRGEKWERRHRILARKFGERVRGERVAKARARTRPVVQRRAREYRPGASRRTASSSRTSSSDPGSGDSAGDPEPPVAVLRVRRPSGTIETFECIALEPDSGIVWATGRWRRRVGLNHREIRYSTPGVYGFTPREIVEVWA